MSEEAKLLSSEQVFTGHHANVRRDSVVLPGRDTPVNWEVVTNRNSKVVMIVPKLSDNLYVMVVQYRHPIGREVLEFPCGGIEDGEKPEDAAARELLEETGLSGKPLLITSGLFVSPGWTDERVWITRATDLQWKQNAESGIHLVYLTAADIQSYIVTGDIADMKTILAFKLS